MQKRTSIVLVVMLMITGGVSAESASTRLPLSADQLARRIDQMIEAKWGPEVKPAPLAEDAAFFRRISLDLNGRIPTITSLTDFLDDRRPNKRVIWVDKLMDGTDPDFKLVHPEFRQRYVEHFANVWQHWLLSRYETPGRGTGEWLRVWLSHQLKNNTSYDRMVRRMLADNVILSALSVANAELPAQLTANTSRLFLGIKLECAQCHDDRSGGNWTREQFWEFAAFFSEIRSAFAQRPSTSPPRIKIEGKDKMVEARFLDGAKPSWKSRKPAHIVLAEWMTSRDNLYFARAAVNRYWHYFFGIGLVDPIDFMEIESNPPSHPELLEELAYQFKAHDFDVKYLIRAITATKAYQRSSELTDDSQKNPLLYARMLPRGLSANQLLDSLITATGAPEPPPRRPNEPQNQEGVLEFLDNFSNNIDRRTELPTSIMQALYMMNSSWVQETMHVPGGSLDVVVNAGPKVNTERRIRDLYLVTLSRKPRPEELKRLVSYVDSGGAAGDRKKALADVFWALLNSTEFFVNH